MKRLTLLVTSIVTFEASAAGFTWIQAAQDSLKVGAEIPELHYILTFGMIGIFILLAGLIYRSKLSSAVNIVIPDKGITFRNLVEAYGHFYDQCKLVIGEKVLPNTSVLLPRFS